MQNNSKSIRGHREFYHVSLIYYFLKDKFILGTWDSFKPEPLVPMEIESSICEWILNPAYGGPKKFNNFTISFNYVLHPLRFEVTI